MFAWKNPSLGAFIRPWRAIRSFRCTWLWTTRTSASHLGSGCDQHANLDSEVRMAPLHHDCPGVLLALAAQRPWARPQLSVQADRALCPALRAAYVLWCIAERGGEQPSLMRGWCDQCGLLTACWCEGCEARGLSSWRAICSECDALSVCRTCEAAGWNRQFAGRAVGANLLATGLVVYGFEDENGDYTQTGG